LQRLARRAREHRPGHVTGPGHDLAGRVEDDTRAVVAALQETRPDLLGDQLAARVVVAHTIASLGSAMLSRRTEPSIRSLRSLTCPPGGYGRPPAPSAVAGPAGRTPPPA